MVSSGFWPTESLCIFETCAVATVVYCNGNKRTSGETFPVKTASRVKRSFPPPLTFRTEISTCHSNLVSCKTWKSALPLSQPKSQHGVVVSGMMEGEAVSRGGGSTSTQRDGYSKPHCCLPLCFPLG